LQCVVDKKFKCRVISPVVSFAILFNGKKLRVHPELALGSEINIFAEISSPIWRPKQYIQYGTVHSMRFRERLGQVVDFARSLNLLKWRYVTFCSSLTWILICATIYRFSSCILFIVYRMQLRGKSLTSGSISCPALLWRASAEQPAMKKRELT
jgi:hypothetical protein